MKLSIEILKRISKTYGDSFYLLSSEQFKRNYSELQKAFRDIYPNTYIAYSYKTNYIPTLCKIVDKLGGYAEVVSGMECQIATKVGVNPLNIFFNGPYKDVQSVEMLLTQGGTVNIDSQYELEIIKSVAQKHNKTQLKVGLRCNFNIDDGVISRFGFDTAAKEFTDAIDFIRALKNVKLAGLHCHFATRSLDTWPARADGMLKIVQKHFQEPPEFISLGGGLFGKMDESLKAQFNVRIPEYKQYAASVAAQFRNFYKHTNPGKQPKLIIEPGTALAGDVMKFVTKVVNIKDIRGKKIATLAGSIYNINPTLNKKNPPVTVFHAANNVNRQKSYTDLDFGGYTCIESDYLFRGFSGKLAIGDFVVFDNAGSYSIVLKPPFILPNFAIVECKQKTNRIGLIKRQETFEDLFRTFRF